MVAYFKLQHNLILISGAFIGIAVALSGLVIDIHGESGYLRMFYYAIFLFTGVVIARIMSSQLANRRLKSLYKTLYTDGDAQKFIEHFTPIVNKVPENSIEYIDGCNKIAFAYEALGEYQKALDLTDSLEPEKLKLHVLTGSATTLIQKLRLELLLKDKESAGITYEKAVELSAVAKDRAPKLSENIVQCLKAYQIWLKHLYGNDDEYEYIREEYECASNAIYRSEMKTLYEEMLQSEI
ncbi:MAG: hypothetical protein PHP50_11680 [Lachnospiraceae bacterium]|nr:hypothetical protein [Lachnospiraceae bacterium]